LGKSVIAAFTLSPSESSAAVIRGAKMFSLDNSNGVLMTDEGSGFNLAAETMNKIHILCRKHFHSKFLKSTAGMSGDRLKVFREGVYKAYHEVMPSDEFLMAYLMNLLQLVAGHEPAEKFVRSLIDERKKICGTHTAKYFTCGCVADSRGEGMNSLLKEGITFRFIQRRYKIYLQFF
jgi:hypothetical protein